MPLASLRLGVIAFLSNAFSRLKLGISYHDFIHSLLTGRWYYQLSGPGECFFCQHFSNQAVHCSTRILQFATPAASEPGWSAAIPGACELGWSDYVLTALARVRPELQHVFGPSLFGCAGCRNACHMTLVAHLVLQHVCGPPFCCQPASTLCLGSGCRGVLAKRVRTATWLCVILEPG